MQNPCANCGNANKQQSKHSAMTHLPGDVAVVCTHEPGAKRNANHNLRG